MIPLTLAIFIFSATFSIIVGLIAIIYNRLNSDNKSNTKVIQSHENRITKIEEEHKHRVEILMLQIQQIKEELQQLKQFVHEKIRDDKHMYANIQQVLSFIKHEKEAQ